MTAPPPAPAATPAIDAAPIERELKLVGGKAALRAAEAALGRAFGPLGWTVHTLHTDYYDTKDRRLAQRGVAFRVRKKDRSYMQTIKAAAPRAAAAPARPEWEQPLPSARPNLDVVPPAARVRMGAVTPDELKKLFSLRIERRAAVIELPAVDSRGAANLEVVIDRGHVRAGRKTAEVLELEIELIGGDPAAIYDLAGTLAQSGLRVGRLTKAERGFRLLDGAPPPTPVRGPKLHLRPDQTVSDALAEIFAGGLAAVLDNEAAILDGTDPEGVHQMRVALRRMRSVLSVFKRTLDADRTEWAKGELKWLMSALAPARDADVFCDVILASVKGFGIAPDAARALRRGAEVRRRAGYRTARAALADPRYTALIVGLARMIETHGWIDPAAPSDHPALQSIGSLAPGILDAAFRKLRKRGKGLADMPIGARHEVRIALKKFRYAVDVLRSVYPDRRAAPFLKALAGMQDQFGHLNDVTVAEAILAEMTAETGLSAKERELRARGAGQVIGWHARGVHDQEDAFVADWQALMQAPKFWLKRGRAR